MGQASHCACEKVQIGTVNGPFASCRVPRASHDMAWHRPITDDGFWCTKGEIGAWPLTTPSGASRRRIQDAEANHFGVSRQAAARRYIDIVAEQVAVVFSHDNRMRYAAGAECPNLMSHPGDPMPSLPAASDSDQFSGTEEDHPADCLPNPREQGTCSQALEYALFLAIDFGCFGCLGAEFPAFSRKNDFPERRAARRELPAPPDHLAPMACHETGPNA